MTSKKKKYREISRQQAEDFYKLGIEFQYRTKAGKGNEWKYIHSYDQQKLMHIRVPSEGIWFRDLYDLEAQEKCMHVYANRYVSWVSANIPILWKDSMQHHDEIADVLKIKFYYRTEVE